MAPVSVACRLSLQTVVVFLLFLSLIVPSANSLLVYDRQTLLNIRYLCEYRERVSEDGQKTFYSSPLLNIPAYLHRLPIPSTRRRRRYRGRRSGRLLKLKASLACSTVAGYTGSAFCRFISWRFLDPIASSVVPLVGSHEVRQTGLYFPYLCGRGVNLHNLRPLARVQQTADASTPVRLALVNARSLANKTFILKDFFTSHGLDFMCITETWMTVGESSAFSELLPLDCTYFNSPRTSGRGGGTATVYKERFKCKQVRLTTSYSSFEISLFELCSALPVLCAVVYRPPRYNKNFIGDFTDFLAGIMPNYDRVLIVGDFNIHVCCPLKPLARDFLHLIDSFSFVQSVSAPTQEQGHTLDLVLTHGFTLFNLEVCDATFSDHMPIVFDMPLICHRVKSRIPTQRCRAFNSSTAAQFSAAFTAAISPPETLNSNLDVEVLISRFTSTCQTVLDTVAPLKTRLSKPRPEPWMNDATRAARLECRRAERKWKKDKLQVSFQSLRDSWRSYQKTVKTAKTKHFSDIIDSNAHNPSVLFKMVNSALNAPQSACLESSIELCETFKSFFINKVADIRALISSPSYEPDISVTCSAVFDQFEPVSLSSLKDIIGHMKPAGSPNDPIPPRLLKEVLPTLAPFVLNIINGCLASGTVPACFKNAVVTPLIKKPGLDSLNLCNFRPISKLSFLSKVLEKIVYCQLNSFLIKYNNTMEVFQSGFKSRHSTESALLRVFNDVLLSTDSGHCVALVLLDLTAAFDTVDHQILVSRLENWVGIKGVVLDWFRSYLSERSFCVRIGAAESGVAPLTCGVPQGSILGPLLFSLYLLPLGSIFRRHDIPFHFYADDCQIYVSLKQENAYSANHLLKCIEDIRAWLSANFLHLNDNKTEVVLFGPSDTSKINVDLGPLSQHLTLTATDLGVKFDTDLKLDAQIKSVVKSSFFHLRQLAKVKPFLSLHHFEILIHAFITARLDYCNALYVGVNQTLLTRLQMVQNAAARLLVGVKKREHITPILASLHWLPVRFRIDFKILLFVFKCLHGLAPPYLSDLLHPYAPSRSLRSADLSLLTVPKTKRKLRGDRAFSVAAPKLWNDLPLYIRQAESLSAFKSSLKTYLFSLAFNSV